MSSKITLPSAFKFRSATDLARLGRDHDGGYLISKSDWDRANALISLGISDDWSFEEAFVAKRDVPVIAYDASVSGRHFWRQALRHLRNLSHPAHIIYWLRRYFAYLSFFRGKRRHVEQYIGNVHGFVSKTADQMFGGNSWANIFLKVDIEGSEYRILKSLIDHQDRIVALVIEFHDFDLHRERIAQFVAEFELSLVHMHPNNYSPVSEETGLPTVMEMTFSRNADLEDEALLPHPLDMPNKALRSDIAIEFD